MDGGRVVFGNYLYSEGETAFSASSMLGFSYEYRR